MKWEDSTIIRGMFRGQRKNMSRNYHSRNEKGNKIVGR